MRFSLQIKNFPQGTSIKLFPSRSPFHYLRSRSRQARTSRANPANDISCASTDSIRLNLRHIRNESLRELATELLTLFQTPWNRVRTQSAQTVIGIASLRLALRLGGHLNDERTTIKRVNEDEAGLEIRVRGPGAVEINKTAAGKVVVLGVDVEVGNFADRVAGGVGGDRGDIIDADTSGIVGLVGEAVNDVLVVVNSSHRGLVKTSVLGSFEGGDVPNVGHGVAVCCGADGLFLIVLVVHKEVLLPVLVQNPALMGVGSAFVGSTRDDLGGVLVGYVVDGEGVLIVTVANVTAFVFLVWAMVDQALGL